MSRRKAPEALWLAVISFSLGCSACSAGETNGKASMPTYEQLARIPIGLRVEHSPNPVKPQKGGSSGNAYTWTFKTSVSALKQRVRITEFYGCSKIDDKWVPSNFTGKAFSNKDFAEWYSCPNGLLQPGKTYSDPNNWSGNDTGKGSKSLWVFVGTTPEGKKVRGEAENSCADAN
ncbi:MAG: hypothetical protein K2W95_18420 [Candidatus Obscuribacterales bacterium]|nr:hypothetical protein [Candidatus Obscuribacterales bacterium]